MPAIVYGTLKKLLAFPESDGGFQGRTKNDELGRWEGEMAVC